MATPVRPLGDLLTDGAGGLTTPDTLCALGMNQLVAGQLQDAQASGEMALAIDPGHSGSMRLRGLVALQTGQPDAAVEWLSRALRHNANAGDLIPLGFALQQTGRLGEALDVLDTATQLQPDDAEAWKHLGSVLAALNRDGEALQAYQRALTLAPGNWEAAAQSAHLLHRRQQFDAALGHFDLCLALRPDDAQMLQARARALRELKRNADGLADLIRAHELAPLDPVICNNIGDALVGLGRHDEGLAWFDKALHLRPDSVDVLLNRAYVFLQELRFTEARAIYQHVLTLDPTHVRTAWQLAHIALQLGEFEPGWRQREARWQVPDFSPEYPRFTQPKWLGQEDIAGKTILVREDEGLGDTIQFARYLPQLAARGAKVILAVRDALRPLLSGTAGVSACVSLAEADRQVFDMHCPVMSLPLALGTTLQTIPSETYLPPLPAERIAAWEARLGPHDRLRVGLVWSGNPHQANDRNRSTSLTTLLPLLDCDAHFVSLQQDARPEDQALLAARRDLRDTGHELTDFVETAALVSCLDIVVTVCTSVAHLAATLGRPTWIMLPYFGDWRWMTGRSDSPWYGSVRLFRQDASRSFAPVVATIRNELEAEIARFSAGSAGSRHR